MHLGHVYARTDFGPILAGFTCNGLCSVEFGESEAALLRSLADRFPAAEIRPEGEDMQPAVNELVAFINTPSRALTIPLHSIGSDFEERVWKALRRIPVGQTRTYTDVAQSLGMPRAVRAVAAACGRNRLAVVVPCHRVIRKDGSLAGYYWGIERKQVLLEREKNL